jgi:hypothetical protein
MLVHARLSATPASHRSVHQLKASSRLLEHHALECILQTHLLSHRIADLATIKTQAVSVVGYFYEAITFSTFPTRSNLRPLVRQGIKILLSTSRQGLKQKVLTSSPIRKLRSCEPTSQAATPPFPSQTSGSKTLEQRRAGQQTPADASCTDSLVERPKQPTETPSATVPCLHNQDSQPPPPRSHRATNHK